MPIPFPLPNPDGCKDNGLECPLRKGETYSFLTVLPVRKSYPKVWIFHYSAFCLELDIYLGFFLLCFTQISLDVKWQLQNEKGETIICVLIPAKIEWNYSICWITVRAQMLQLEKFNVFLIEILKCYLFVNWFEIWMKRIRSLSK